jgi:hypothetical protein
MEHPAYSRTHQPDAQPNTNNWIASQNLSEGEHRSRTGWIFGRVGRLMNNMNAFKMGPHGVGRISQPAVGKCVGGKQITKFIVDGGLGNPAEKANGRATDECQ